MDYRRGEVQLYYYQLHLLIRWNSKRKTWDYSIRGKKKQNHWSLTCNNSSNFFQVAFHFGLSCPSKAEEAHSWVVVYKTEPLFQDFLEFQCVLRFLSNTQKSWHSSFNVRVVKTRQRADELRVQVDLRGEMDVKLQQTFQADLPEKQVPTSTITDTEQPRLETTKNNSPIDI